MNKKTRMMLISLVLILICAVGLTLAWLTDKDGPVQNTFTTSDINITLTEETESPYEMIPGYDIDKDPVVTVLEGSEPCWLFVEITEQGVKLEEVIEVEPGDEPEDGDVNEDEENTNPEEGDTGNNEGTNSETIIVFDYEFRDFIEYEVSSEWTPGDGESIPANVFYRKVLNPTNAAAALTADAPFDIIGYTDLSGNFVPNKVLVKDTVTKEMMDNLEKIKEYPTLTFKAYAAQLYKTNPDKTNSEFTAVEAWNLLHE